MFFVEILQGINKKPIRIEASQLVVRLADGTPVMVGALYGGPNGVLVSHCGDDKFAENLAKLNVQGTVIVDKLRL